MSTLRRQGFRVDLIRVSDPREFELPVRGVLRDPEGDGHRAVPQGAARRALQARLEQHRFELEAAARSEGAVLVDCHPADALASALTRFYEAIAVHRGGH